MMQPSFLLTFLLLFSSQISSSNTTTTPLSTQQHSALTTGIQRALDSNAHPIALKLCQKSQTNHINGNILHKLLRNTRFMERFAKDMQNQAHPLSERLLLCLLSKQQEWPSEHLHAAREVVKISALTLSARLLTGMIQQGGYINQTYTFGPLCTLPRVFNVPRCVGTHVHRTVPTGYTVLHLLTSRWHVVPIPLRGRWFFQEAKQIEFTGWMSRAENNAKLHSRRIWGQVRDAKRKLEQLMTSTNQDQGKSFEIDLMQTIENSVRAIILDKILSIDWDNNKENWKQAAQSADVLTGFTPLHHLAWSGNTAGIEIFISRFPNVINFKDKIGRTALDVAIELERFAAIKILMALGGVKGGVPMVKQGVNVEVDVEVGVEMEVDVKVTVDVDVDVDSENTEITKISEKTATSNGGWDVILPVSTLPNIQHDICQVDVRTNITAKEFYNEYLLPGRPLLLRGYAKKWRISKDWTLQKLIKKYGDLEMKAQGIPYADLFGKDAQKDSGNVQLKKFIQLMLDGKTLTDQEDNELFIFQDPKLTHGEQNKKYNRMIKNIRGSYPVRPSFLFNNYTSVYPATQQFYVGPPGGGAPIHLHVDAWNACAYGKRQWFLFPPKRALYSKIPMRKWVRDYLPKLKTGKEPLQCTQKSGDVLYVPNMWGHGTMNIEASVGVAVEFESFLWNRAPLFVRM